MKEEPRISKAMADGAEFLVRQIEQCQRIAAANIDVAWTERDTITGGRSTCMDQAFQFIRLAGEIGTALAKLKGHEHRQHIAVERIEPPKTGHVVRSPYDSSATRVFRDDVTGEVVVFEAVPPLAAGESEPANTVGERDATRRRGEGEGYDKQLDVVDADLEPAS